MDGFIAEAREAHAKAAEGDVQTAVDAAAKLVADMEALKGHIGG